MRGAESALDDAESALAESVLGGVGLVMVSTEGVRILNDHCRWGSHMIVT